MAVMVINHIARENLPHTIAAPILMQSRDVTKDVGLTKLLFEDNSFNTVEIEDMEVWAINSFADHLEKLDKWPGSEGGRIMNLFAMAGNLITEHAEECDHNTNANVLAYVLQVTNQMIAKCDE